MQAQVHELKNRAETAESELARQTALNAGLARERDQSDQERQTAEANLDVWQSRALKAENKNPPAVIDLTGAPA
jgi:chromosome segregation ATPase